MQEIRLSQCPMEYPSITLTPATLSLRIRSRWCWWERQSLVWDGYCQEILLILFVRLTLVLQKMAGNATAEYVRDEGTRIVSTLSIPLADVFSNPTLYVEDNQRRRTNIQLCPGR